MGNVAMKTPREIVEQYEHIIGQGRTYSLKEVLMLMQKYGDQINKESSTPYKYEPYDGPLIGRNWIEDNEDDDRPLIGRNLLE